jgi:undecaprenyl-diphosphatase
MLRSITVIGWTMILFGILLYVMDQRGGTDKTNTDWTRRDAIIMGLWQAVALIPGTSRSGITITAARQLGYDRYSAAKLSMLMSVPIIFASGALLGAEVILTADTSALRDGAIAAGFSFLAALLALSLMMRLLRSINYTPYVIYRILLGIALLAIAYS